MAWGEEEVVTTDLSSLVTLNGIILIMANIYWLLFTAWAMC